MKIIPQAELMELWAKDSIPDKKDLHADNLRSGVLHSFYINQWALYSARELKLKAGYDAMKKLRARYYRGELTQEELVNNNWVQYQGPKLPKTETETFLSGDSVLQSAKAQLDACIVTIKYLDNILKFVHNRSYAINKCMDYEKFQAGF